MNCQSIAVPAGAERRYDEIYGRRPVASFGKFRRQGKNDLIQCFT
jgi:hypothetical protein